MKGEKFEVMVREALNWPNASVKNLGIVGGMTNLNYLVDIDGEKYIVRIAGNGTEAFINREQELRNLKLGSTIGINPELLYFNIENGMKITKEIENAQPIKREEMDKVLLGKVSTIFRTLHHSESLMNNQFQLFSMMDEYESLALTKQVDFYDGFDEVKMEIKRLQQKYNQMLVKQSPCHIDPACSNFLADQEGLLYLIDWEYGGMFDALWDIAAFSLEAGLTLEKETLFYQSYFQRTVTEEEQERMLMHKIFQDYLWSLWTLFKEGKGDDFGLYGLHRFERAKENMHRYKINYEWKSTAQ